MSNRKQQDTKPKKTLISKKEFKRRKKQAKRDNLKAYANDLREERRLSFKK